MKLYAATLIICLLSLPLLAQAGVTATCNAALGAKERKNLLTETLDQIVATHHLGKKPLSLIEIGIFDNRFYTTRPLSKIATAEKLRLDPRIQLNLTRTVFRWHEAQLKKKIRSYLKRKGFSDEEIIDVVYAFRRRAFQKENESSGYYDFLMKILKEDTLVGNPLTKVQRLLLEKRIMAKDFLSLHDIGIVVDLHVTSVEQQEKKLRSLLQTEFAIHLSENREKATTRPIVATKPLGEVIDEIAETHIVDGEKLTSLEIAIIDKRLYTVNPLRTQAEVDPTIRQTDISDAEVLLKQKIFRYLIKLGFSQNQMAAEVFQQNLFNEVTMGPPQEPMTDVVYLFRKRKFQKVYRGTPYYRLIINAIRTEKLGEKRLSDLKIAILRGRILAPDAISAPEIARVFETTRRQVWKAEASLKKQLPLSPLP